MSVMAWGGKDLYGVSAEERAALKSEIKRTEDGFIAAGVEHLDLRDANMLWNEVVKRVMFIDFGRTKIKQKPSGLKRTWKE